MYRTKAIAAISLSSSYKVPIDIRPGDYPNNINLRSKGAIPVAILSTSDFDATTVDPDTVALSGAPGVINKKGVKAQAQDVNVDGLLDLVVHIAVENLILTLTIPLLF